MLSIAPTLPLSALCPFVVSECRRSCMRLPLSWVPDLDRKFQGCPEVFPYRQHQEIANLT